MASMQPGEIEGTGESPRPRATPPPLPIRVQNTGWTTIATFASHAEWHSANKSLIRHGIAAQMRTSQKSDGGVDLLVMQTEAEWARDLIERGDGSPSDGPTGGLPLNDARVTPGPGDQVRAIPVQIGLTDRQKANYSAAVIVLWVILAIIVVLLIASML